MKACLLAPTSYLSSNLCQLADTLSCVCMYFGFYIMKGFNHLLNVAKHSCALWSSVPARWECPSARLAPPRRSKHEWLRPLGPFSNLWPVSNWSAHSTSLLDWCPRQPSSWLHFCHAKQNIQQRKGRRVHPEPVAVATVGQCCPRRDAQAPLDRSWKMSYPWLC